MNALAMIPETAPFTPDQRAWLNGFLTGLFGDEPATGAAMPAEPEDMPWHDPALALSERLALAEARTPAMKLMAAMAQLDCGQCGYQCQSYAEAIWAGDESSLSRCVPGGKETSRKLVELKKVLEGEAGAAPRKSNGAVPKSIRAPGISRDAPSLATLLSARKLSQPGSEKDVRHVVLDLAGSGISYKVGDSLGLYPRKNPELVQAVIDRLGATGEEIVGFDGQAMPLRQILLSKVDIARPSDNAIAFLARRAFSVDEAAILQALAAGTGPAELSDADLLDLLQAFQSVSPSLPELLANLDRLQPRLYSIASSPKAHPNEVHLTVSAVRWTARERTRTGVASCYLADFASPGDAVPVYVQPAHGFALPENPDTPVIMIGPGTGIAPFRAFLEERETIGAKGPNWLFFGDQRRACDFLYEGQITDWQRQGVLTRLDLAFSRDQENKIYVQTRMREAAAEMWRWLEDGAHLYVCGDAKRMAKDVDDTLIDIAAQQGRMQPGAAKEFVAGLAKGGRYQRDVY